MGNHGSAYGNFTKALERGNVIAAETAARELGTLRLVDALELTALVAKKDPRRSRRIAARWLEQWLSEAETPTIDDVVMVAAASPRLAEQATRTAVVATGSPGG